MGKRKRSLIVAACFIVAIVVPILSLTKEVNALNNVLSEKFYAYGFRECYRNLRTDIPWESPDEEQPGVSQMGSINDLFQTGFDADNDKVGLPASGDTISCKELFSKYGMEIYQGDSASINNVESILRKLGYAEEGDAWDCFKIDTQFYPFSGFAMEDQPLQVSPIICAVNLTNNKKLQIGGHGVQTTFKNYVDVETGTECVAFDDNQCGVSFIMKTNTVSNSLGKGRVYFVTFDGYHITKPTDSIQEIDADATVYDYDDNNELVVFMKNGDGWDDFKGSIGKAFSEGFGEKPFMQLSAGSIVYTGISDVEYSVGVNFKRITDVNSSNYSFSVAFKNIFGHELPSVATDAYTFSREETSALYNNYLVELYKVESTCYDTSEEADESEGGAISGTGVRRTKLYDSAGNAKICFVKTKAGTLPVHGVKDNWLPMMKDTIGYSDIADWLNENGVDKITDTSLLSDNPNGPISPEEGEDGQQDGCWASGSGVGWVICPVLNFVGGALDTVYDYVEGFLRVDPKLFSDGNNTVYNAWNQFRNFANIIFVILLLFVIFSQLTGYGIDNYGIKKILPKLIVAAVLINLSYVICQICVDLSNIIGNGLQALFNSLSESLGELSINVVDDGSSIASGFSTGQKVLISSSLVAALIAGLVIVAVNPMVLISLLVAALGVLIGVLFLFVLLVARQAIVIILITISPIAFALNILPNTKKLFSKWVKIGEAMLLLYPICGLLVGGGNYVSKLLLSVSSGGGGNVNLPMALASSVVGIAPIFFIPSVLKGSFAGFGKVGGMLTGLSDKARRATTGKIRGSDGYKNLEKAGLERKQYRQLRRRAGGRVDANGRFVEGGVRNGFARSRFGRLIGADRRMAKNRQAYVKAENSRRDDLAYLENEDNMANAELTTAANDRMKKVEAANVGVVAANRANVITELQNERMKQEEKNAVGVVEASRDNIRRELENERIKAEVEVEVGPKPRLNRDNLRTRTQNAINEAIADNDVPVLPVNVGLATQRRQAARDAEETKIEIERLSNLTPAQLLSESRNAGTWLRDVNGNIANGAQSRMSALLQVMEQRGLDNDITNMLSSNNMSDMSRVMSTLTGSKNVIFSAYGKRASRTNNDGSISNVDFNTFMTGGDNATNGQSLSAYFREKGGDSVSRLDDKSLKTINNYQGQLDADARVNGTLSHKILTTDQLVSAASKMNNEDSLEQVNNMLANRNDIRMSGEELSNMHLSTINKLSGNASARQAILRASDDAAKDPKMVNKFRVPVLQAVNTIRMNSNVGLGPTDPSFRRNL